MNDRVRLKKESKKKGKRPELGLVFGRPLAEVVELQNDGTPVPKIVRETIAWLENHGAVNEEGLFRVPGQMTIIDNLKKEYDTNGTVNLERITDIASVAGLLKLYMRELPEPLLIFRFYSTFIKIAKNPDASSRLRNLRILVNGLPEVNKSTVFYILRFLSKVVASEQVNRMSASNLAVIFSPNLLRSEKEELSKIMMEAGYLTSVVKMMIEEIEYISQSTNIPATIKTNSSGQELLTKMELVPLEEMVRRLSIAKESGSDALSQQLEASLDVDKMPEDESSLLSEQKNQELEDLKRQVKEKEDLLKLLQEQLDEEGINESNESESETNNENGDELTAEQGHPSHAELNNNSTIETEEPPAKQSEEKEEEKEYGQTSKITLRLDEFGGF